MTDATTALVALLNDLRMEDIDTFADTFYLLAGDLGVSFDDAGCFYDLVDTDRLLARMNALVDLGVDEGFLVLSVLRRFEQYVLEAPERAFRAVIRNQEDLSANPDGKPDVLLNLAKKTNARLLSVEAYERMMAFQTFYIAAKQARFSPAQLAAWQL